MAHLPAMITFQASIFLILSSLIPHTLSQAPTYRRFEYKHSFRAPNLSQRDGSIPFWMVTGDAIASSEQLRLAPSMRSRKGIAWNKRPFVESESFELEMAFKVTGQGRIGADGLALWYLHILIFDWSIIKFKVHCSTGDSGSGVWLERLLDWTGAHVRFLRQRWTEK